MCTLEYQVLGTHTTHDLYLDTQVLECTHHGTHGHACTKYQYLVHGTWTLDLENRAKFSTVFLVTAK